jgi:hypothetical protein
MIAKDIPFVASIFHQVHPMIHIKRSVERKRKLLSLDTRASERVQRSVVNVPQLRDVDGFIEPLNGHHVRNVGWRVGQELETEIVFTHIVRHRMIPTCKMLGKKYIKKSNERITILRTRCAVKVNQDPNPILGRPRNRLQHPHTSLEQPHTWYLASSPYPHPSQYANTPTASVRY